MNFSIYWITYFSSSRSKLYAFEIANATFATFGFNVNYLGPWWENLFKFVKEGTIRVIIKDLIIPHLFRLFSFFKSIFEGVMRATSYNFESVLHWCQS